MFKNICIVTFLFLAMPNYLIASDIIVQNTSKKLDNNRFSWEVYLDVNSKLASEIEFVQYTLHPTFKNPIIKKYNRYEKFALKGNGWGEFNIILNIKFKNGEYKKLEHWLILSKNEIASESQINKNKKELSIDNTSKKEEKGKWEWTAFIEADDIELKKIKNVEYILHPSFKDPIVSVNTDKDNFSLTRFGWGIFEIKANVTFFDGTEKKLSHILVFNE